jgi:hypothetical protein
VARLAQSEHPQRPIFEPSQPLSVAPFLFGPNLSLAVSPFGQQPFVAIDDSLIAGLVLFEALFEFSDRALDLSV